MIIIDDIELNEESSYGSGTEASIPPPPPPATSAGIFRNESFPKNAQIIIDADDESIETLDASYWPSYWNNWFLQSGGVNRKRRACAAMACVLVVCMCFGLALGYGMSNRNDDRSTGMSFATTGSNAVDESAQGVTADPSPVDPVDPVVPEEVDTVDEEPEPVQEEVEQPTIVCTDMNVQVSSVCLRPGQDLWVTAFNCAPEIGDWIGLYEVSQGIDPANLGSEYVDWMWACNSKTYELCEMQDPKGNFAIPWFGGLQQEGTYRAFMVRNEKPYSSLASSVEFVISNQC